MNNIKIPSWDELFFRHVYLIASKSKDNRTKIGSVLVKENRIISEGYNGMPRKVNDNVLERYNKPDKYFYFEHSERNVIYNCAYHGIRTKDSILFTNGIPCSDCARAIIQSGIFEVVVHAEWQKYEQEFNWKKFIDSAKKSRIMFDEANIKIRIFDGLLNVNGYLDGKIIKV